MKVLPKKVVFREDWVPYVCVLGQSSDALVWIVLKVIDGPNGISIVSKPAA